MYYIRDCTGNTIGNLKGYRTMRGAKIAFNRRSTGIKAYIDNLYYERKAWYDVSMMPIPLRRQNWYSISLDTTTKG